jgi:hypothetical protein
MLIAVFSSAESDIFSVDNVTLSGDAKAAVLSIKLTILAVDVPVIVSG